MHIYRKQSKQQIIGVLQNIHNKDSSTKTQRQIWKEFISQSFFLTFSPCSFKDIKIILWSLWTKCCVRWKSQSASFAAVVCQTVFVITHSQAGCKPQDASVEAKHFRETWFESENKPWGQIQPSFWPILLPDLKSQKTNLTILGVGNWMADSQVKN